MKKFICVLLIFSSIVLEFINIGQALSKEKNETIPFAWKERARIMKAKMNDSADYCDDFYNYACGGYVNSSIPDDKDYVDVRTLLKDKVIKQLNTIIKKSSQPYELKIFKLVKHFYKLCIDTEAIEKLDEKPLFYYLEQLGGWPVLKKNNEWNETLFNWNKLLYKSFEKTYWSNNFFEFNLSIDIKNNTRQVITLNNYSPRLPREYLLKGLNDESVINYYNYMINMSVALGAEKKYAEKELIDALEFEIKLTNLTRPDEDHQNQSLFYNPMTLGNLTKKYPYFQWKKYLNYELSDSNVSIDDDEIIIVTDPDYFDKLGKLINSTPKKVQANLVMWLEIQGIAIYMSGKIQNVYENYVKITTGEIIREPRMIECTHTVSLLFPIAINALYIREYIQRDSKDNVAVMLKNIHNQFIKLINNSSLMDKETKSKAINKVKRIKQLVAFPDELLNDFKINDYHKVYENFEMNNNNYIDNFISLSLIHTRTKWIKLKQKYNSNNWLDFATVSSEVNAFYSPIPNSIELPAGVLQDEFFNNELPKYINYGAIGSTIGRQIMSSFNDKGKQYDVDGNVADWWSNFTNEQFKKIAQCIIHQYGNYTVEGNNMTVNTINTQEKDISDNGGIKAVYRAYNDWLNDNNNNRFEQKLPEFNFSPRQMFWISYASTLCFKSRNIELDYGDYSPSEFRVNGPLSNLEEFSTDFSCPKGSKMNPEKKCTVW